MIPIAAENRSDGAIVFSSSLPVKKMRALNLYTLTRINDSKSFSGLENALSGRPWHKHFSSHEAASLCALVNGLADCFMTAAASGASDPTGLPFTSGSVETPAKDTPGRKAVDAPGRKVVDTAGRKAVDTAGRKAVDVTGRKAVDAAGSKAGEQQPEPCHDWVSFFDGFYFSYTIEHISKEFDLLKFSADADCALNIELKSEEIGEDRIRKQLDQNRYYLSHVSRTILSYTYVLESNCLYCLNDHGYLRKCPLAELAVAMQRPALQTYVEENIGQFFRAQDYLISPIRNPEKLLTGRYFLTNQQSEFRRQILEVLQLFEDGFREMSDSREAAAIPSTETGASSPSASEEDLEPAHSSVPIISLTGNAGTGKTLLLFDLAIEISKKKKVLFVHGGPLREGHRVIDSRLHKVHIFSGTESSAQDISRRHDFTQYACILVDEANRFDSARLEALVKKAIECGIPCIISYDPHSILGTIPLMEDTEAMISRYETLRLELSGNIRINRPIFSFLRTLFHQKEWSGSVDYSCIDVLYAADKKEERSLTDHYLAKGYELIRATPESFRSGEIISQEYERVLMVLDKRFYYDESMHLCADGKKGAAIPPLYEGLSRAREKLCLLITGNETLFRQILAIRTHTDPDLE